MDFQKFLNPDKPWNVSNVNGLVEHSNFLPVSSPLSQSSIDSGYSGLMEQSSTSPTQMGAISHQMLASSSNNAADIINPMQTYDYNDLGDFQEVLPNFYSPPGALLNNYMSFNSTPSVTTVPTTLSPKPHIVPAKSPVLEIVVQPSEKPFRFRYYSEMHGTHGSLMGAQGKKSYPSVALRNFPSTTKAMIRCSLYQVSDNGMVKESPHSHKLVKRRNDIDRSDPHDMEVSIDNDFTAVFDGLGIIHTAKKHIKVELFKKIQAEREFEENRKLTVAEQQSLKKETESQYKEMNLNQVCLCFQAFIKDEVQNIWVKICPPVYSNIINNMKSALTGELKITRMSTFTSSASGGQEVFMFVEKVCKNNIKVKFFEHYDDGAGGSKYWEEFGIFQESDVHHQYGIVLKTPAYREKSIDSYVDVKVQLFRPKDGVTSEALDFRYKPNTIHGSKRRRTDSTDYIPTVVGSHESNSQMSCAFGTTRQETSDTCAQQFNRSGHQQSYREEESMYFEESMLKGYLNTFPLSPEDVSSIEDLFVRTNFVEDSRLEIDAVCSRKPTARRTSHELNLTVLEKLKMLIKLFKNNFDGEKLREMICVLIDSQDETGENIFLDCIEHGSKEDVKDLVLILLKYKLMDVLKSVNDLDRNCIHLLILAGYPNLLKIFLNLGVDANQADAFGNTPMHLAVLQKDQESVNELLSGSVDLNINELNDDGLTALHIATANDDFTIVKLLVEAGVDVLRKNPTSGDSVLHIALSTKEPNLNMISYLIECDETLLYQTNNSKMNVLHLAMSRKMSKEIVNFFSEFYDESYNSSLKNEASSSQQEASSFDEKCINELCSILDKNQKWKEVAFLLELYEESNKWENEASPTRSLLKYLEQTKKPLDSVIEILISLEEKRAINVIDEMMARKLDKF